MLTKFYDAIWSVVSLGHNELKGNLSGLILGLRPANERRRYKVTPSVISQGWANLVSALLVIPSFSVGNSQAVSIFGGNNPMKETK